MPMHKLTAHLGNSDRPPLGNLEIGFNKRLACAVVTWRQHRGSSLMFLAGEMRYRDMIVGNQVNTFFHLDRKASI